jgi:hypothetical protein
LRKYTRLSSLGQNIITNQPKEIHLEKKKNDEKILEPHKKHDLDQKPNQVCQNSYLVQEKNQHPDQHPEKNPNQKEKISQQFIQNNIDIRQRIIRTQGELVTNLFNLQLPKNDIIIFILAYDEPTYKIALTYTYDWAFPIYIPGASEKNPLFENIVFHQYESLLRPHILERHKYVGLLSWKANQKLNMNIVNNRIQTKQYRNVPYIHFDEGPVAMYKCHPFVKNIWDDIFLKKLGPIEKAKFGYCNYFVTKKNIFEKYVAEMKLYIPLVLSHPKSFEDARYPGSLSKEKLIKLCGKPWYPHVPFVLERTNLGLLKFVSL